MSLGILCIAGVVVLWGSIAILVKVILRTIDPFTLAFLRLFQGTAVLVLLFRLQGGSLRGLLWKSRWIWVGAGGACINFVFYALSLHHTTASSAVLIVQVQFVLFVILTGVYLRERVSLLKICCMGVTICGVVWVVWSPASTSGAIPPTTLGNLLMLLGAGGWAVYALANKALSRQAHSFQVLIPMLGLSAMAVGAFAFGRLALVGFESRLPISLSAVGAVLLLGIVCTGGSFYLQFEAFKRLSSATAGTMTSVSPLLSILLARWLLGEGQSRSILLASGLIVIGIVGIVQAERTESKRVQRRRATH